MSWNGRSRSSDSASSMASVPARTPSSKALTRDASTLPHLPHTRPTVDLDCLARATGALTTDDLCYSARPFGPVDGLCYSARPFGLACDLILRAGPVVSPLRRCP